MTTLIAQKSELQINYLIGKQVLRLKDEVIKIQNIAYLE